MCRTWRDNPSTNTQPAARHHQPHHRARRAAARLQPAHHGRRHVARRAGALPVDLQRPLGRVGAREARRALGVQLRRVRRVLVDAVEQLLACARAAHRAGLGARRGARRSEAQLSGIEKLDFLGISAPSVRDMEQLGRCLNLCKNLWQCDLGGVGLTDEPCRALFSTLKFNAVLTELRLSSNKIGGEGAKALASTLRVNGVLTNLRLNNNIIRDEGAKAIAEALRGNGVLTSLVLRDNNIGDEGAAALASALRANGAVSGRVGFELKL